MKPLGKVKLITKPEFPFPYVLKVSQRAKRLSLKLTADRGVQVIMPRRISEKSALRFLQQHSDWVLENTHIWQQQPVSLPGAIALSALEQTWQLQYEFNPLYKRSRILQAEGVLTFVGQEDDAIVLKKLRQWIKAIAESHFQQRLSQLSQLIGLPYNSLSIRQQRTLWGSCNHKKAISLNGKLIFCPSHLIDYVMIHELVHTLHMNHGKQFWQRVGQHMPSYKKAVAELRQADKFIPAWYTRSN